MEEIETPTNAYVDSFFEEIVESEDKVAMGSCADCSRFNSDSESDGNPTDEDGDSSTSESSVESEGSDTDDQKAIDSPGGWPDDTPYPDKTFSPQEESCMAVLSLVLRHCITTEAAKYFIDLLKVIYPHNETFAVS